MALSTTMNQAYLQKIANSIRFTHINDEQLQAAIVDTCDLFRCGNVYVGRVQNVEANYIWVDIGAFKPALLKCRSHHYHQGMKCIVRIKRESQIHGLELKGPQVVIESDATMLALLNDDQLPIPRLLKSASPLWLQYINKLHVSPALPLTISIDDVDLFNRVRDRVVSSEITILLRRSEPIAPMIDHYWQDLLSVVHPLPHGGHLLLEETAACSVFDLNTSAQDHNGVGKRLNNNHERLKFNQAAVPIIIKLIQLRDLSGTMFVDFLRLDDWHLQQQLLVTMRQSVKHVKDLKVLGFTPGGWIELCRPVHRPSLQAKVKLSTV